METSEEQTIEEIIEKQLTKDELKHFNKIYYGRPDKCEIKLKESTIRKAEENNFQVKGYCFTATQEEIRKPKIIKVGVIQNSIVLSTDEPVEKQREAIYNKVRRIIEAAAEEGVNILCLQETWSMPFFLCTREKKKWEEFSESYSDGPTTTFVKALAKKYKMVIVSPILEVDETGTWWNTAVVINEKGNLLGKHRKNHLPSVGSFSETDFYSPGDTGHPVFETKWAKIAINICYGRHHALNWMMFALNGAEIVFNPAATVSEFGESFWTVEARNAAFANCYFTISVNRVGTEEFSIENHKISRSYYGSSYLTAPDGSRTPVMSRTMDGLLIAEIDLNLCRQVKDYWGLNSTARLDFYAEKLKKYVKLDQ